jgi:DNA mismatch repair protein MutS2
MLYDTGQMKPLFQLVVGRPGSSFAFEMARKIGLSEDILKNGSG